MSAVLEGRTARQARARAHAATILDTPHVGRRFVVTDRAPLVRSPRRRVHSRAALAAGEHTPRRGRRRLVVAVVLLAQLVALATLLVHPAFRVHSVDVSGERLLSADAVSRMSGAPTGRSIFLVDTGGVRKHLLADPWIVSATVETALPSTLHITITERQPVLRVRGPGLDELVALGGATVDVAGLRAGSIPVLPVLDDQRPSGADGHPIPIDPLLLGVLSDTAASFERTVGVRLAAFRWQADGVMVIVTQPGWIAVLGHLDDPARVAAIPDQLASLLALRGRLDLARPTFGYIDLENPEAVAVGGKPGPPQQPPVAATSVAGAPATSPAPAAQPTPIVVGPAPQAGASPAAGAAAAPGAAPPIAPGPTPIVVPSH